MSYFIKSDVKQHIITLFYVLPAGTLKQKVLSHA